MNLCCLLFCLAITEGGTLNVLTVFCILQAFVLAYVTFQQAKFGKIEDRLNSRTDQRVDERLAALKSQQDASDGDIEKIDDRARKEERDFERRMGEFGRWMTQEFATKKDLERHEEHVTEEFKAFRDDSIELGKAITRLATILEMQAKQ